MDQGHLFRMPRVVRFKLTDAQKAVLDWVALNEGRAAAWPGILPRKTLRLVIAKGLVKVIGLSPGRYMLTGVGRMARQSRRHERVGSAFFEDAISFSTAD